MSWRDLMPVHPAADIFPLLDDVDLVALGNDIKANGLLTPIAVENDYENGPVLIDGRNRLAAMERVGIPVRLERNPIRGSGGKLASYYLVADGVDLPDQTLSDVNCDPVAYIIGANIHRRHLTAETKRTLIAQLLKQNPERSDRATAELVKVDHKTVAAVRRKEEDVGSIPHVDKVVDTKGRQQPAHKAKAKTHATVKDGKLTQFAEMGKKVHGVPEEGFKRATHLIGTVKRFADFCQTTEPAMVTAGVLPHEVLELRAGVLVIQSWLKAFALNLQPESGVGLK